MAQSTCTRQKILQELKESKQFVEETYITYKGFEVSMSMSMSMYINQIKLKLVFCYCVSLVRLSVKFIWFDHLIPLE